MSDSSSAFNKWWVINDEKVMVSDLYCHQRGTDWKKEAQQLETHQSNFHSQLNCWEGDQEKDRYEDRDNQLLHQSYPSAIQRIQNIQLMITASILTVALISCVLAVWNLPMIAVRSILSKANWRSPRRVSWSHSSNLRLIKSHSFDDIIQWHVPKISLFTIR